MANVLILGAHGQIARVATDLFLKRTDVRLILFLRNARRLKDLDPLRGRVIEGDVPDQRALQTAMAGQDVVYANLAGQLEQQTRNIVAAMDRAGRHRRSVHVPLKHGSSLSVLC